MSKSLKPSVGGSCWILSDGKAGNDVQSLGVASALGLDPTMKRVTPRGVQKLFSPWVRVAKRERFGQFGAAFAPPWPDIALAIGRLTTPYIRELKRRAGDSTFTVILQDPKVPLSTADLFWVPEHDRLRGPNVITTLTAPHSFTELAIADLRREMPSEYASLRQPRVAVLLGGSNSDYRYSPAALQRLWRALKALGASGASFLITPSRRTEPTIIECARLATQDFPRMFWDMRGRNPYPEYLAFADMFLAPADSVNMTSEPCATGRPVYVFHPDGGSPKFTRFHTALCRHGATRPFPETLERMDRWSYEPLTSAALIADQIATRFAASVGAGRTSCDGT